MYKRVLTLLMSLLMLITAVPVSTAFAADDKAMRKVYLHAQGSNPTETVDSSTVYMGDTFDLYFAVDDPNKGERVGSEYKEPQYDLNGYTVKIYFDRNYFEFAGTNTERPINFRVPNENLSNGSEIVDGEEVPSEIGYYEFRHGTGTEVIDGRNYSYAYIIVLFSGHYLPDKKDNQLWYNLCSLPLKPLRAGSTDVFIETGADPYTLELFSKNTPDEDANTITFDYSPQNSGYHHIVIKDQLRPSVPVADPPSGSYTEKQNVTLTAEPGCKIYYTTDGSDPLTNGI